MTAGRYYWDLLRVEGAYNGLLKKPAPLSNYLPTNTKISPPIEGISENAKTVTNQLLGETVGDGFILQVNKKVKRLESAFPGGYDC